MRSRRPLLLVLAAALPALAILLGLGWWQVQRLEWKTAMIAAITASEAGPAVPLGPTPPAFTKVLVEGVFRHDLEALLGLEVRGTVLGAELLVPLERPGLPTLLVDRGWVPMERGTATIDHPQGVVAVTGFIHPGDRPGIFAPRDDTAGRRFYTFDPPAIGAALGLPDVAPFALVAIGPATGRLPDPAHSLPRPANNHLGYVITWWGLAVALLGVLAAVALRRRPAP
ncbi:surfeit locus 1 family protein [Humitalea rosea]|uniref:SURF1-like protein n=1 Tax=Humitalea rosea TaxID=990373 RepID=A0A2W7I8C0_9PROT|nr:SURF1 family protein [Humitalea rosea]PZW43181.1 surfeit locus 1 family protein [Humitalea rosea]